MSTVNTFYLYFVMLTQTFIYLKKKLVLHCE